MFFDEFANMTIVSKVSEKEECSISFGYIEFKTNSGTYVMNDDGDTIIIELEDKFSIALYDIDIDKVNFNYDNINNSTLYIFKFDAIINHLPYECIINDAYINNKYEPLNKKISKLNIETRADSKLIAKRLEIE